MNVDQLKSAGFNDQEIRDYTARKRVKLRQAGFSDDEVNKYLGESLLPEKKQRIAYDPLPFKLDQFFDGYEFTRPEGERAANREDVARSLYPLAKPFLAQGYTAAHALNRGLATFSSHLDSISEYIESKTGFKKGGIFQEAAKAYEDNADYWKKRADQVGINFIDELIGEAAGGAGPGIAEFLLNIPYAAVLGAAEAYKKGESEIVGSLVEAAKRGVLGAIFHALGPLKQYLRAPLMGGVFGVQAAGEGADVKEIAKSVGTGALYSLSSPGGRMGLNEIKAEAEKAMVRMEAERPRVEPVVGVQAGRELIEGEAKDPGVAFEPPIVEPGKPAIIKFTTRKTGAGEIPTKGIPMPEDRDWIKKTEILDEKDEPLTVYHGTDEIYDVFDQNKSNLGKRGFFFTTNKEYAEEYGARIISAKLDIRKPLNVPWLDTQFSDSPSGWEAAFSEVGVEIKFNRKLMPDSGDYALWELLEADGKKFIKALKKAGYDGVAIYERNNKTFITTDPKQIKILPEPPIVEPGKVGGIIVYRGGDIPLDYMRGKKEGISVSTKKEVAENFIPPEGGVVSQALLPAEAKILQEAEIPKGLQDSYIKEAQKLAALSRDLSASDVAFEKLQKSVLEKQRSIVDYARSKNYDAVDFPFENEIRIIKPGVLKEPPRPPIAEPGKPAPPPSEGGGFEQPKKQGTLFFRPEEGFRREPAVGKPGEEAPMGRADILRFLQEKLDIPIRTGRFRDKALGIFKVEPEVIRARNFADIEVIAHEVGHALQKFLWPESMKGISRDSPFAPFADELLALAGETTTLPPAVRFRVDPLTSPPWKQLQEGFGEFMRIYITNPVIAEGMAPRFYQYFDHLLDQRSPESKEVFLQVRAMFEKYMKQPAYQRVRSQISIGEEKPKKHTLHNLYTMVMDEFHPLKMVEREMSGKAKVPTGYSPYNLARLVNGWIGKANAFLRHRPFEFKTYKDVGESLEDILRPAADRLEELSTYMVSRRVPDLEMRGIDVGIRPADAMEVVKQYEKEFEPIFQKLQEYQDQVLKYLRDSGILSAEAYDTIKQVSKDYDPFYRVFEEEPGRGAGGLGRGLQAWQPVKEIKGGWQRIQDPIESIIKNTMLYINLAERNAVGKALVDMAEKKEGMGKFVEEIPTPMYAEQITLEEIFRPHELEALKKAGIKPENFYTVFRPGAFTQRENVISVWIDGVQRDFQVSPEVFRTYKALDREGANTLEKLISIPAKWLRAGSVLTPEFIARNPFRDQFTAFVNSKYGFVPGVDLARGIFHLFKKDQLYWDWQKSGAASSTFAAMDREYFQEKMGDLLQKYPIVNLIKNPIEALRVLGEIGEIGTRLGEFSKATKKEGMTKEAIQEAGFAAAEVTVHFRRIGAKTRAVNSIIAFWNANLQAMDREVRAFRDDPTRTTLKAVAAITLPSILLAWVNHDDPRYWEIPQWQRDLCWIVFPNHMSKEEWESMSPEEKAAEVRMISGSAWRFPKPWELGILFGSIPERMTHYIMDRDPEAFSKLGETIMRSFSPGVIPNFLVPWLENQANYSFFFDRNIVPGNRIDLPPEYQYAPYTTDAAKALGEILGKLPYVEKTQFASPAKVENLVRGWTGGLGYYAMELVSAGLRATGAVEEGAPKPARTFADIPFIKAFAVRYPSSSAESIQEFYDRYKEGAGIQKAIEVTAKEFKFDKSLKLMVDEYAGNLEGHRQSLSRLHDMIEMIYNHPEMTPDEKREFVDICYFQMIDIARNGVEMIKDLKKIVEENRREAKEPPPEARPARIPAPRPGRSIPFEGGR